MRDHFDPAYDAGPLFLSSCCDDSHFAIQNNTAAAATSSSSSVAAATFTVPIAHCVVSQFEGSRTVSDRSVLSIPEEEMAAGLKRHVTELYDGNNNGNQTNESVESGVAPLDCRSLQSSLKRVKLSCSPGELRLQRDLTALSPQVWQVEEKKHQQSHHSHHHPTIHTNHSTTATTWFHPPTGARLKLVDSLRLHLFLPVEYINMDGRHHNRQTCGEPSSFLQHPQHHQHRSYLWRMMIQIPRMFPHRPPVVTRLEGNLWVHQIVVNEAPPSPSSMSSSPSLLTSSSSSSSILDVPPYPEVISLSSPHASAVASNDEPYQVCGGGRTVVWNKWSPIASLGDLLDVLLTIAHAPRPSDTSTPPVAFHSSSQVVSDESAWMWSSTSSSSSFSSLTGAPQENSSTYIHKEQPRYCYEEEHKSEDTDMAPATTTSRSTTMTRTTHGHGSPQAQRFLTPNRFDVGYEKYNEGTTALVFSSAELQVRRSGIRSEEGEVVMETS